MNYILTGVDTDNIKICKPDMSPMTKEELDAILNRLNEVTPSDIVLEEDGYYANLLMLKSKNYVTRKWSDKDQDYKVVYHGSSLINQQKEVALGEMLKELCLDLMLNDGINTVDIYHKYIKEALNIQDINRWSVKKTVTEKLLSSERTNESKVRDALDLDAVQEGDKVWLYAAIDGEIPELDKDGNHKKDRKGNLKYKENKILKTVDNWTGDQDKMHYVARVYKTVEIMKNVLDISKFIDYAKKKNLELLENL